MSSSPGLSNAGSNANNSDKPYKRVDGFGLTDFHRALLEHACAIHLMSTQTWGLQLKLRPMSDTGAAVPQGRPSSQVDEITATMTAVCMLLVRQCLGATKG